jgi:hypothetical protein
MDTGPEIGATKPDGELASPAMPVDRTPEVPDTGAVRSMVDMIASLRSFETGD